MAKGPKQILMEHHSCKSALLVLVFLVGFVDKRKDTEYHQTHPCGSGSRDDLAIWSPGWRVTRCLGSILWFVVLPVHAAGVESSGPASAYLPRINIKSQKIVSPKAGWQEGKEGKEASSPEGGSDKKWNKNTNKKKKKTPGGDRALG